MLITVDTREPIKMVAKCKKVGMEVERKKLDVGDYACKEMGVGIERKEINDFCLSIMDNRLEKQINNMKKTYKHNYILVSGLTTKRYSKRFSENAILGKIASIMIKDNVCILILENDRQLVYMLGRIFYQHEEKFKLNKK